MGFIFGAEWEQEALRLVRAVQANAAAEGARAVPLQLVLNVAKPLAAAKSYTPLVVPVRHRMARVKDRQILLVTKDPLTPYRDALAQAGHAIADDGLVRELVLFQRLKKLARSPKLLTKLYKEHDLVVADHRVHKLLPEVLREQFYAKHRKVPFMVQMARPDAEARLVRGKRLHKLKDERCDPVYVLQQLRLIVHNTWVVPSTGDCVVVRVGFSDWDAAKVVENMSDVVLFLTLSKHRPVGGMLLLAQVRGASVKTSESAALPVYKPQEAAAGTETYDEFDF